MHVEKYQYLLRNGMHTCSFGIGYLYNCLTNKILHVFVKKR